MGLSLATVALDLSVPRGTSLYSWRCALSKKKSPRSRAKGFKPSGAIADGVLKRGRHASNIWYAYSEKAKGDVLLRSDAEFLHLLWAEGDSSIASFTTETPNVLLDSGDEVTRTTFDMEVKLRSGSSQLREVKSVDSAPPRGSREHRQFESQERFAAGAGREYVRVGPRELEANQTLISNWKIGLAYLAAAREHSLVRHELELMVLVQARGRCAVHDVLQEAAPRDHSLVIAALFRALGRGDIGSDITTKPWGWRTAIWVPGTAASTTGETDAPACTRSVMEQLQAKHHASRQAATYCMETDVATVLAQTPLQRAGKYTRKTVPKELSDTKRWPDFSEELLPVSQVARVRRCRAALRAYLEGQPVVLIAKEHGVHRSDLTRLLNRAVTLAADGKILGWRALVKWSRAQPPHRTAPAIPGRRGGGMGGALTSLFLAFPDLQRELDAIILRDRTGGRRYQEACINPGDVHREFLTLCAERGLTSFDYPFNTKTQGVGAIRTYVATVRAANFAKSAAILGGAGAGKRAKLESGLTPLLRHEVAYEAVCQDAHKIDCIGTVRMPHPSGMVRVPMQRLSLQPIVDNSTRAVLGYHVTVGAEPTSEDSVSAVKHALSVWEPMKMENAFVDYPSGAGFPSGLIPELAGAAWSTHYVDNASIYTSTAQLERIRRRVGCAVNLGPVGDWTRRCIVEAVFSVLTKRGFQRLPNTTGAHPKDPRRRDAEKQAVDIECDWSELIYLIDVALATYNATEIESLGARSPLQALKDLVTHPRSDFLPRRLPELVPGVADLDVVVERRVVRGNIKEGRRPYIEIDGVHYTSSTLANCAGLIGRPLGVYIRERDMRTVTVYLQDGGSLGVLTAGRGWNRIPHDRNTRRQINALLANRQLMVNPGEDYVQAYLRKKSQEALKKQVHKPAAHVSREATQVAALSRQTGLPVPELSEPAHESVVIPLRPMGGTGKLPRFVKPTSRRAIY